MRARGALSSLFLLHGFVAASWVARIPAVSEGLGLGAVVLGTVLMGNMAGSLLGGFTSGGLVDRFGSRRVAQLAALAGLGSLLSLALLPSAAFLFVGLGVYGLLMSYLNIAINAQATALEARYGRPIFSSFHALWSLGALLGALSGAALAGLGLEPWLHFALVGLVGAATVGVGGRWLLETPVPPIRRVFALPRGPLLFLGLMGLCTAISDGSIPGWSGVYLRGLGAPESVAAMGFAVHQSVMLLGRLSGDWLAARYGAVRVVRFGALFGGLGLALGVLSQSVEGALLGIACMGWGMATLFPMMFAAAANTPGLTPASAIASVSTMSTLGGLLGPILLGAVAEVGGVRSSFLLAATLAGVVSWLAFSLSSYRPRGSRV
ncbi:Inner membrane protein YbjJ [Calidithermus terrae]|uniref:Inner membrane protein YbjJ n=1 Tax=Calidithermus terrae TaxID=1408545 RepID=A0A399EPN2_9DEIN|nr:Inner membrane protein YbjJ [Calidithermus terrae]